MVKMSEALVTYQINQHYEEGSYWAEVIDLPGCFASGETLEELQDALAEAIGIYLSTPGTTVTLRPVPDGSKIVEQQFLVDA